MHLVKKPYGDQKPLRFEGYILHRGVIYFPSGIQLALVGYMRRHSQPKMGKLWQQNEAHRYPCDWYCCGWWSLISDDTDVELTKIHCRIWAIFFNLHSQTHFRASGIIIVWMVCHNKQMTMTVESLPVISWNSYPMGSTFHNGVMVIVWLSEVLWSWKLLQWLLSLLDDVPAGNCTWHLLYFAYSPEWTIGHSLISSYIWQYVEGW